jgi:hypothetical protein
MKGVDDPVRQRALRYIDHPELARARMAPAVAIPHTFTIDTDGVLQDEHIGDGSIEGKLKKLLAHARETQQAFPTPAN